MRTAIAGTLVALAMGALASFPSDAQDKGADKAPQVQRKVLFENDKVQALEFRYKPGAVNTGVPRTARVVRALTSGTLKRTYPDGKTEDVKWKAGEVRYIPAIEGAAPQYSTKNTGKSDLVLYLVVMK